jgi:endonuclease/exonuclease/phosphatase family metal-dependent hydrolase
MWDLIKRIKPMLNGPWLMLGDFNEALWQEEHISKTPRAVNQMDAFREVLDAFREVLSDCNLVDLGFAGVPYTYDNKRQGRANVKVCLDRAVADCAWRELYADTHVQHLTSPVSDHFRIL